MKRDQPQRRKRLFYGWYVVAGAFFANWMGGGLGVPTFGLFFKPMSSELGWTRAVTTIPLVVRNGLSQLIGPIVGPLVDRYGPRDLMTVGALIAGVGTILMSQTNSVWQFFLFWSVIGAIGNAGLSGLVTNTTVAKWFVRQRGRATGIANTGINVGEGVMTPLIHLLITSLGWRRTWMIAGLIPWLVIAPTSFLLMRRAPEDMGLRPDGDPGQEEVGVPSGSASPGNAVEEQSWTAREAFRMPVLWLLVLATSLSTMAVSGVVIHQIPFLTDQGLSPGVAALSLTLYAVFAILSKLVWGFLADRIHIRYLTAACYLSSAGGLLILLQADTVLVALVYGVVYGATRGSFTVVQSLIWSNYFGRHFLGSIRGYTAPFTLFAGVGGPLLAAYVFDSTQSYRFAFSLFVGAYVLAALLILAARPPVPSRQATTAPMPSS